MPDNTPFSHFDKRHYRTLSVVEGYSEWSSTYERTVPEAMTFDLLNQLHIQEIQVIKALDIACGTGLIGKWLKTIGVSTVDGIDLTQAMLDQAHQKGVYQQLVQGDCANMPFKDESYDLAICVLADEHFDLGPYYQEASRILKPSGTLIHLGYHPYFLMLGVPTHYDRPDGESIAIRSSVHQLSEHFQKASMASFRLIEFKERLIDEAWLIIKPKWKQYLHTPVSFMIVWEKD